MLKSTKNLQMNQGTLINLYNNLNSSKANRSFYFLKSLNNLDVKWREIKNLDIKWTNKEHKDRLLTPNFIKKVIITMFLAQFLKTIH